MFGFKTAQFTVGNKMSPIDKLRSAGHPYGTGTYYSLLVHDEIFPLTDDLKVAMAVESALFKLGVHDICALSTKRCSVVHLNINIPK